MTTDVTGLLRKWSATADVAAFDRAFESLSPQLETLCRQSVAKFRMGHTLSDPAALLSELYIKVRNSARLTWSDRADFQKAVRAFLKQILIDYERRRNAQKRGGRAHRVPLDKNLREREKPLLELLAFHQALDELAALRPDEAAVAVRHFYWEMSAKTIETSLGISPSTRLRRLNKARIWLRRRLGTENATT